MANIQFLNNIDLKGNSVIAIVLDPLGSDPATLLNDGRIWYRTDTDLLRLRANGGMRTIYDSSFTLDLITVAAADVSLNSHKITSLATPTASGDAATKGYVDGLINGLDWKASVRVATTGAGTLATSFENGDAIDGVTLATGDRILIKDQAAPAENGIYVVAASGAPVRATDADASAEVTAGLTVGIAEGTANADTIWFLTTNDAITIGSTSLAFSQLPGATSYVGGNGLTLTGNSFAVNVDDSSIEINSDTLRVKAGGITNTMLAGSIDLTTKVTGVLPVANGGTNANTTAGAKTSLGFMTRFAGDITGDGSAVSFAVTHSLGTKDVLCKVVEATTDEDVMVGIVYTSTTVVTITFAVAPAISKVYRVVVIG